jgi:hypothetical protein
VSYEGYVQCLCENGHYYENHRDPEWDDLSVAAICPVCRAVPVWKNSVDESNHDSYGIIPIEQLNASFLATPEETRVCDLGCLHVVRYATYRIPSAAVTRWMRHHRNDRGYLVPNATVPRCPPAVVPAPPKACKDEGDLRFEESLSNKRLADVEDRNTLVEP